MKSLRSITTGRLAASRWALFGSAVLWLSIALSTPAHATNYTIEQGAGSGFFSGSFSLNTILPNPFTVWNITSIPSGTTWTDVAPPYIVNAPLGGFDFRLLQVNTGITRILDFQVNTSTFLWTATDSKLAGLGQVIDGGTIRTVPEPTVLVLLAIGLLFLAGSRWLPSRRERQQLR